MFIANFPSLAPSATAKCHAVCSDRQELRSSLVWDRGNRYPTDRQSRAAVQGARGGMPHLPSSVVIDRTLAGGLRERVRSRGASRLGPTEQQEARMRRLAI